MSQPGKGRSILIYVFVVTEHQYKRVFCNVKNYFLHLRSPELPQIISGSHIEVFTVATLLKHLVKRRDILHHCRHELVILPRRMRGGSEVDERTNQNALIGNGQPFHV